MFKSCSRPREYILDKFTSFFDRVSSDLSSFYDWNKYESYQIGGDFDEGVVFQSLGESF